MPKPLVEDLPRLDTLDLKPIHCDQPMSGKATWIEGSPLNLEFNPNATSIMIRWGTPGSRSSQLIQLLNSRPNCGGMRRWFVCPETGKNARILYFWRGCWVSKKAIGAACLSQRQTAPTVMRRSQGRSCGVSGALMGGANPRDRSGCTGRRMTAN